MLFHSYALGRLVEGEVLNLVAVWVPPKTTSLRCARVGRLLCWSITALITLLGVCGSLLVGDKINYLIE